MRDIRDSAPAAVPRASSFVRCPSTRYISSSSGVATPSATLRIILKLRAVRFGRWNEGRAIGFRRAVPRLCSSLIACRLLLDDERPVLVLSVYVDDFSSLLHRYDLLVSMRRCIVRRDVFVVLRGTGRAGRGLGGRESAAEAAANDVHDQKHTEQSQNRD